MKWVAIILGLWLACSTTAALARLGETPDECAKRYGASITEGREGKFLVKTFNKAGFLVRVFFLEKREVLVGFVKAQGITYTRPTQSGVQNQPLSQAEIGKFLEANCQGEDWTEINLLKEAATLEPGPEQAKMVQEANEYILWKRKSGAEARYVRKTHQLVIRTADDIPLPDEKAPSYLEGF